MLDAIAGRLPGTFAQRFYVGDMPDDMLAAARSRFGFHGVGLILAAPDKAGLKQALFTAGARFVVETPTELQAILESALP
jgi:phosphoglycolate phosphatase-like HAD superfamily hydrolase